MPMRYLRRAISHRVRFEQQYARGNSMSQKHTSNEKNSQLDSKAQSQINKEQEDVSKRRLLFTGIASGIAAVAAACGPASFSTKTNTVVAKKPTPKPTPGQKGNGEGIDKSGANSAGKEDIDGVGGDGKTGGEGTDQNCAMAGGAEKISLDMPSNPALIVKKSIYGDMSGRTSTMIAVLLAGLKLGDLVLLVKKDGIPMSRKTVGPLDLARAIIFDGLRLVGIQSLEVVVISGAAKSKATLSTTDGDFSMTFNGKPVVDIWVFRNTAHGNYPDFMPTMGFGDFAGGVNGGGGGQSDKASSVAGRLFQVATDASTWPMPTISTTHMVTDVLGTEIGFAATVLASHNILLIYTLDNDHYHRYFYTIG